LFVLRTWGEVRLEVRRATGDGDPVDTIAFTTGTGAIAVNELRDAFHGRCEISP
jgi:hypothetical protein